VGRGGKRFNGSISTKDILRPSNQDLTAKEAEYAAQVSQRRSPGKELVEFEFPRRFDFAGPWPRWDRVRPAAYTTSLRHVGLGSSALGGSRARVNAYAVCVWKDTVWRRRESSRWQRGPLTIHPPRGRGKREKVWPRGAVHGEGWWGGVLVEGGWTPQNSSTGPAAALQRTSPGREKNKNETKKWGRTRSKMPTAGFRAVWLATSRRGPVLIRPLFGSSVGCLGLHAHQRPVLHGVADV